MSAPRPHHLADMTTEEAALAVTERPVVLLAAGAFEQHGPALPLATDLVRAEAVTERVAARLAGRVVIGPHLPVGVSPHHVAFPGTLSLSVTTFRTVVREYLEGLYRHGWRKVLIVTGHGGNNASLTTLAQDLLADLPDLEFAWTPLTTVAADVVARMPISEVHGHSGEAETAQMLHLAPGLVHTDRFAPGTRRLTELDALSRLARRAGHPTLQVRYDRLSANGVLGDPARATAEDGAAIVDRVVDEITDFVEEWLQA
ncbi:creatininase family protein [Nocardiopsis sp. MG754419]|uniref:creatininase family protein n=1 Tax=Nocardiopsis sp. MG754419 TaxID=2259865 RepID=UPI001BA7DF85|nr:creatininase family protein [Nocardiopsis sp. MG754419]MBR8742298.1 creatininase family protein [Nocardiopsis sp. MG754419]